MGAEFFVGTKQGEFGLEEWKEMISRFPQYSDRAISSALKSEGYRLQQIIKLSIQQGGPESAKWPALQPHTLAIAAAKRRQKRWAAKRAKGGKVRASTIAKYGGHTEVDPGGQRPLARLAGATRYYYDDSTKSVTIGFLDQKKRGLAKKHAEGYTQKVDSRMRKLLAAHGFPVREGTTLKVPPRPVVAPVFEKEKGNIIKNIQEKAINNIYRYLTGKGKDEVAQLGEK
jgi:hypothetical protein